MSLEYADQNYNPCFAVTTINTCFINYLLYVYPSRRSPSDKVGFFHGSSQLRFQCTFFVSFEPASVVGNWFQSQWEDNRWRSPRQLTFCRHARASCSTSSRTQESCTLPWQFSNCDRAFKRNYRMFRHTTADVFRDDFAPSIINKVQEYKQILIIARDQFIIHRFLPNQLYSITQVALTYTCTK